VNSITLEKAHKWWHEMKFFFWEKVQILFFLHNGLLFLVAVLYMLVIAQFIELWHVERIFKPTFMKLFQGVKFFKFSFSSLSFDAVWASFIFVTVELIISATKHKLAIFNNQTKNYIFEVHEADPDLSGEVYHGWDQISLHSKHNHISFNTNRK